MFTCLSICLPACLLASLLESVWPSVSVCLCVWLSAYRYACLYIFILYVSAYIFFFSFLLYDFCKIFFCLHFFCLITHLSLPSCVTLCWEAKEQELSTLTIHGVLRHLYLPLLYLFIGWSIFVFILSVYLSVYIPIFITSYICLSLLLLSFSTYICPSVNLSTYYIHTISNFPFCWDTQVYTNTMVKQRTCKSYNKVNVARGRVHDRPRPKLTKELLPGDIIRAHRLSDPPMPLPTITISPPASAPSSPLSIRKASVLIFTWTCWRRCPRRDFRAMSVYSWVSEQFPCLITFCETIIVFVHFKI